MPIKSLYVGNFKGIEGDQWIPLKPVTLFVGPNSSGKSSWIHALACLSQTMKLPNNRRPISLDDEYASVHLGRFIEVIHSKSYQDAISLGVEIPDVRFPMAGPRNQFRMVTGDLRASYTFKSTLRTQNTYLHTASLVVGAERFDVRRISGRYEVSRTPAGKKVAFEQADGFLLRPIFRGGRIAMETFAMSESLVEVQRFIQEALRNTLYLGPFRQPPQRRYPTRGASPAEVGPQGESAVTMLANEVVQFQVRPHIKQVAGWLNLLGLAKDLEVSRVGKSDLFGVNVTLKDGDSFPLADLGYGLSQVLPVLAQCSFAPAGSTLLFEQPEIHLHTLSAKPLAKVFAETARRGVTVVAETHSPQLVWATVGAVRDGIIARHDVALYRVTRRAKRTELQELKIEDDMDVYGNWESGISAPE